MVRTDLPVALIVESVRQLIRQLDVQATMHDMATMDQVLANSLSCARLYAVLLGVFALTALVLGCLGIYSVLSHSVAQRSREIGIRMALGAQRLQVVWVLGVRYLLLTAVGALLGLGSGAALSGFLTAAVAEVSPATAATYLYVAALCCDGGRCLSHAGSSGHGARSCHGLAIRLSGTGPAAPLRSAAASLRRKYRSVKS